MERRKPHKNLELWTKVMEFVTYIYRMSKDFPREEEFGLKSQLRRAAVSIPSNISEGLTRWSKRDRLHFLNMAQSSLSEINAQVEVSRRLGLINGIADAEANDQLSVIEMMLNGLIRSIRARN